MRTPLQSHFTVIEKSALAYASIPAFKVPKISQAGIVEAWVPVTYSQFRNDLDNFARYWMSILYSRAVKRKSVVALWLQGMTYADILHILGLSRAGYIPQLLCCSPNLPIVFDLLRRGNAQALICDSVYAPHLPSLPIPIFNAVDALHLDIPNISLPSVPGDAKGIAFIFHTAGTTLGTPKLVPCNYGNLDALLRKAQMTCAPKNATRQDIYSWKCTVCHASSLFSLFGKLTHGSCLIQPTRSNFSSGELADMIARGGVNRLHRSTSHLTSHIREFRKDRNLAHLLSGLDEIVQSGKMLGREEEEWLAKNGLPLVTVYGTTEVPVILVSDTRFPTLLRPLEGVGASFVPFCADAGAYQTYRNVNTRVLELVIPADSPCCPDPSLRNPDGNFHTGDLFLEVSSGLYAFRGRVHDWLHCENGRSFDAKTIEDNVRLTCAEFIAECVVVGNGRPSPVLLVEPSGAWDINWGKQEIIRRTRHFHSRRLPHERITSASFIVVVATNSWPRTPIGNIRRQDVEEAFKTELDRLYAAIPLT